MFSINNLIFKDILNIRNLEINRDNITCITGESGCGKSTLLKMLNRMLTPDSGNIKINDTQINDIDVLDLRRKVLMVSQNPVIFEGSIRDNLISGCRFAKKSIPSDDELKKILEIFRLNIGLEKSPENLSGGEKQRISLVRALLTDPEVLLLDEPSSALDEGTEDHVISSVVKHASDRKITLIIVTHSMLIAEKFCEINIRLEKGKIYDGCTLKEEAGV